MAEHQTVPLSGHSKMAMHLPELSFSGKFSYDFEESLRVVSPVASVEKAGRSQPPATVILNGSIFPDLNFTSKYISKPEHHILSDTGLWYIEY